MIRLLGQGLAILVSILIAFWIDAWWEQRKEQEQQRETLLAILDSLQAAQEKLAWSNTYTLAIADSARALLNAVDPDSTPMSESEILQHMGTVAYYNAEADLGAELLNALVASGGLADIENPVLRARLAGLAATFSEAVSYQRLDQDFTHNRQYRFWQTHANINQIFNTLSDWPGHPGEAHPKPDIASGEELDYTPLLNNREWRNLLALRVARLGDLSYVGYPALELALADTIAAISEELERL